MVLCPLEIKADMMSECCCTLRSKSLIVMDAAWS